MTQEAAISQKVLGERIRKLRQEHGYSQEALATYLGLSRQAIGKIEKGERSIDALELAALAKALALSVDWIVQPEQSNDAHISSRIERNLNFSFDITKFRQTLLYILSVCGGKAHIGETVLYKLLYFIDFNAFEVLGKPVTGMQYVKMQFGPVPRQVQYRAAVQEMVEKNELKIFTQEYYGMPQKRYVALVDSDIGEFSLRETVVIDRVLQQLADFTARKIADYAHGDAPWILAEDGEPIRYTDVVERAAPYAHVTHLLEWEHMSAKDVFQQLGPMEPDEAVYYQNL